MRSSTSRCGSMPGATSISSTPRSAEAEHRAIGDVHHLLAALAGVAAVEGQLLHGGDPLRRAALLAQRERRPRRPGAISRPPVVSVPENTTLRAPWLMLMNPPGPFTERP